MWKLSFLVAAFAVAASPLDAKENRGSDLRRDVEKISKEIYPSPPVRSEPAPRPSFAAGRAAKKR